VPDQPLVAAPPTPGPRALRNARVAVAACFFVNAVLFANFVPRMPEVKAQLDLSNASLGAALAAFPLGALLAALSSAALIRRAGSARVASFGLIALALTLWGVSVAPNWGVLAAVLLVAGALDAIVDVAQNAHGLRVQRLYNRSILNGFHGIWSIGAVSGGLLGSAAAGLGVPLPVHLAGAAVVFGLVAVAVYRGLLPGGDDDDRDEPAVDAADPSPAPTGRRAALPVLAALGVLAACGAFVEDAGASWSALYLRTSWPCRRR
jgi:MFS family permease